MDIITIDSEGFTIADLVRVAREGAGLEFSGNARERIDAGRALIDRWVREGKRVYGVTTGFGALCDVAIPLEDTRALQENILMSHAAGVGNPLAPRSCGESWRCGSRTSPAGTRAYAVRRAAARRAAERGVVPVVPEKGSVGASGDLAPIAHLALVLIGKGEAFYDGRRMNGAEALAAAGLRRCSSRRARGSPSSTARR